MILAAVATTLMMLFILFVLPVIEPALLPKVLPCTHHIHIKASSVSGQFIATVYDICAHNHVSIDKIHLQAEKDSEIIGLICRIPAKGMLVKVISELRQLPDVISIQSNLDTTYIDVSTPEIYSN